MTLDLTRRQLLGAAGAALVVSFGATPVVAATGRPTPLTGYLEIAADGAVTVFSPVSELGQGTHAAHAAIIADELGVDIEAVSVVTGRPSPAMRRANPAAPGAPPSMGTGGSWGVRWWREPMRRAAAQARTVLIAAAAADWGVDPSAVRLERGRLISGGRSAGIGVFAAAAAALPLPEQPALRPDAEARYTGRKLKRADVADKARGRPVYTSDIVLPGMVHACARLSPVFRSGLAGFDEAPALAVRDVLDVIAVPGGAAVVATHTWAAMKGAEALAVTLEPAPHDGLTSAAISADMRAALDRPTAAPSRDDGDWDAALAGATRVLSADYEVPYLAHAAMEPFVCVVRIDGDTVEVWSGTQAQDRVINGLVRDHGLKPENIVVHTRLAGGGFGRRLRDEEAFSGAYTVARATGRPVKFFWTREDEMGQGWYRPAQAARLTAALDGSGGIAGLRIRTAGPSMRMDFAPGGMKEGELDGSSVQSLADTRYRFGAYRLDYAMARQPVPTAPWTAVGATQNGYFLECFLDEVAAALSLDPYQLRRRLLAHDPRALRVIDTVAEKSGWGTPAPAGRARGMAYVESYGSLCAQVAEVSLVDGFPKVHRMVVALDCGDVVTPDGAAAQVEGRVISGISAALREMMTVDRGRAVERNFDSYAAIRMPEVPPVIETHFVRSGEPLGGVGEPPLPPSTPAVVNAVAKLLGKPIRRLPISAALAV
jgi:isoquinoline 1-oxidoreductase beta subunit